MFIMGYTVFEPAFCTQFMGGAPREKKCDAKGVIRDPARVEKITLEIPEEECILNATGLIKDILPPTVVSRCLRQYLIGQPQR